MSIVADAMEEEWYLQPRVVDPQPSPAVLTKRLVELVDLMRRGLARAAD